MPPKLVIPPEVGELVLRFGELEIGINVRRASSPTGASSTWELVSAADSSTGTGASLAALPHVSSNLVAQSLAASSAADFAALPLGFLDHLVSKLRGTDSAWVPQARVGRAFKAGVVASLRLEGECSEVYIILRAPGLEQGGWTPNYSTYLRGHLLDKISTIQVCRTLLRRGLKVKLSWQELGKHGRHFCDERAPQRGGRRRVAGACSAEQACKSPNFVVGYRAFRIGRGAEGSGKLSSLSTIRRFYGGGLCFGGSQELPRRSVWRRRWRSGFTSSRGGVSHKSWPAPWKSRLFPCGSALGSFWVIFNEYHGARLLRSSRWFTSVWEVLRESRL